MAENTDLGALNALISMMDEPDEKVYSSLKNQLLLFDEEALPALENAWMAATDLLVVARLEELIEEVNFRFVYKKMTEWLETGALNLQTVMLIVNKLGVSDFNESETKLAVESLFKDAWLEMNENLTALEKIKVLNHIFFTVHKYKNQPEVNGAVEDFFLSELIITKEGNATSIGMLYLSIAQYLKLPVFGVNLPGHLILAYIDDRHLLKNVEGYVRDDVMFYINPFNGGAVFTDSEIDLYIGQVKLQSKESYFLPATNKIIVHRYLMELSKAYKREEKHRKEAFVEELLKLFV